MDISGVCSGSVGMYVYEWVEFETELVLCALLYALIVSVLSTAHNDVDLPHPADTAKLKLKNFV